MSTRYGQLLATVIATGEALDMTDHVLPMAVADAVKEMRRVAGPQGRIHWETFSLTVRRVEFEGVADAHEVAASARAFIDEGDPFEAMGLALAGNRPAYPIQPRPEPPVLS